ncbi:MAG: hypothetical protein K1X66_02070 [Verrucomicrobiae bacterium]|nr:hypothetical protein [Verrucomicrobiae bacterium]
MMRLDVDHSLVLYDSYGQWKVWLVPGGNNSVFQNSLTVNGNNSVMPNQSLSGDGSILTRKLGDGRYVAKGADKTALGYATATGFSAFAAGNQSLASGGAAVALGEKTIASGDLSFAVGGFATASGYGSVAMGETVTASGESAFSLGLGTIAQGMNQVVVGRYNVAQGSAEDWVATDDLFVVGNGTSANQRSNAFTVKKNGDAVVKGNATVKGYSYFNDINTDNISAGGDVMVSGVTEMMSSAYVGGDLQVNGKLYLQPQGDVPMGQFNQ